MVIDCRGGDVHLGFLSLIKILYDCCSHMTQIFCLCKRQKNSIQICTCACAHPHADPKCTQMCIIAWPPQPPPKHTQLYAGLNADFQVSSLITYVLHESIQIIYIIACRHIQSPVYEKPTTLIDFYLFIFFLQFIHCIHSALRTPDKSPLFILLQQREFNHVRVQRMCDWLALSPCDYLHFIQSGQCTGTKSSACYSHPSLSSSSNIPHTVSSHLYWTIVFCGINFNSILCWSVRFQIST